MSFAADKTYKVTVGGVEYGMDRIRSGTVTQNLFDAPGIGNTCCATLNLSFWPETPPPRAAEVRPYIRRGTFGAPARQAARGEEKQGSGRMLPEKAAEQSGLGDDDWELLGIFWIDQRTEEDGLLTITAYDAMMKAEAVWKPADSLSFPMTMEAASRTIAAAMGTELDERCVFNPSFTVDHPAGAYTMREVLGYIAAAHAGNWQVTAAGKLLLTPLYASMPPETYYLIEEKDGGAITFGGTRILTRRMN